METKKSSGMFAVIAALIANILVAISKFVGFALSGSTAMMNESIHSVVDCSNQVLLLFGNKRASRGQSALHQFGEGRAKYFFSTIVATMLFFGGGALGVMEAIQKLLHPSHEVENVTIVIGILIFGLLVEGSSLRVAMKEIKELNTEKLSLLKFLRESRHSEILIIFTEDFCAVIGLCLALVGTLLTMVTGIAAFDAISGLLIGLLLMCAAIFLAKEFYSLIIGESVTATDLAKIKTAFDRADVEKLIDVKTVHLGPTEILVAAKIDVVEPMEEDAPDVVNAIERDIRSKMPDKKIYIYIEVDDYDVNYVRK
ncbi:cation diffusion facilitator family transporter [Enterococcus faecalis]|uniref:cation diffusion facilitator family transporter n=1 Tax=Enterococcus TaxID=1350 RepID=UPI000354714D|nr:MULTISPECIES: cation diffusion facilitator family transporter [Enterococcus]EGO2681849.1 cation diffusion facilitator family transporter [Enterococcus faecalis]EGO2734585.1 cation diffusion facilitator family transporter [Enterococcus faecalis]EGO2800403.1 cation diffusion facilitator family transporter [Enterococcus faecalis]EGO5236895.1 cation diffusion facilitator family transporter [Enterococcus faecalis]EGO6529805.1 cation diffusion facilitator family transporter [Enterococcus faecalis